MHQEEEKKPQDFRIHWEDHLERSDSLSSFSACMNYLLSFCLGKSRRLGLVVTAPARITLYTCRSYGSFALPHSFYFWNEH